MSGVARQLLQPRLPVTIGVQRSFQAAVAIGLFEQHFRGNQRDGFLFPDPPAVANGVHQTHSPAPRVSRRTDATGTRFHALFLSNDAAM